MLERARAAPAREEQTAWLYEIRSTPPRCQAQGNQERAPTQPRARSHPLDVPRSAPRLEWLPKRDGSQHTTLVPSSHSESGDAPPRDQLQRA